MSAILLGGLRRHWRPLLAAFGVLAVLVAVLWYYLENPVSQTFGNTVTQVPIRQKVVALTFDDGPNPPYTNQIVDYLCEEHVPATFFVVGKAVEKYPAIVRKEELCGDAVGNHSWDHAHLVLESRGHLVSELKMTDTAIYRATGRHTNLFRPPFGARDFMVIQEAHRLGYEVIMWSVPLPRDWQNPPPTVIANRVMAKVKDGGIIVLHDGNRGKPGDRKNTVAATRLIVRALQQQGYKLVTVPELIRLGYEQGTLPPGPSEYEGEK